MRVFVTGATGFVGRALISAQRDGMRWSRGSIAGARSESSGRNVELVTPTRRRRWVAALSAATPW